MTKPDPIEAEIQKLRDLIETPTVSQHLSESDMAVVRAVFVGVDKVCCDKRFTNAMRIALMMMIAEKLVVVCRMVTPGKVDLAKTEIKRCINQIVDIT